MTAVLLSILVVASLTSNPVNADRGVLITFDGDLILVKAIVLFTVFARACSSSTPCHCGRCGVMGRPCGAGPSALQQWQSAALPVFAAWAAVVALVFPPVFSFH